MENSQSSQQGYLEHGQYDNNREHQQSSPVTCTTQTLLAQLSRIYSQVLEKQKSLLNQLLNLQKLLNHTLSTQPLTQNQIKNEKNNNSQKQKKTQQKKQFNLQRIGQKIQQIIDQTDEVIVAVEEEKKYNDNNSQQQKQRGNNYNAIGEKKNAISVNNKKITLLSQNKKQMNKQLTYKLQTMQEKKPPIPTQNRAVEGVNRVMNTVKYVPPRNKNQVTGKVTQTKILTQDKVFRPEVTAKVGSSNLSGKGSSTSHLTKISSVDEKRQTSSISSTTTMHTHESLPSSTSTPSPSLTKPSLLPLQDINSISQYKVIRATTNKSIKLKQFSKGTQQVYQQYMQKKQSVKKGYNFNKLLQKYQQQEMGHKGLQQKRRLNYIKKLNHLGLSMNVSTSNEITHSIAKRAWKGYPHIFEFNQLLERMQQDISRIQQQYKEDLRSDPKEVYRIHCGMKFIEREVGKIVASTEIEVPEKLELTFEAVNKKEQDNQQQHQQQRQSQDLITLQPFYQQLLNLLQQTKQHQSLSIKDLSLLRVIAEISLFDGRRTPMLVKSDDLQEWREFYHEVDDNQHQGQQQQQRE